MEKEEKLETMLENIDTYLKNVPEFKNALEEMLEYLKAAEVSYIENQGFRVLSMNIAETEDNITRYIMNYAQADRELRISKFGAVGNYFLGLSAQNNEVNVESFRYWTCGNNYNFEQYNKVYKQGKMIGLRYQNS